MKLSAEVLNINIMKMIKIITEAYRIKTITNITGNKALPKPKRTN